ncbi:uncharacterized [Tachysurus ichikawai]
MKLPTVLFYGWALAGSFTIQNIYCTFKRYHHIDATACHLVTDSRCHSCDAFNHCESMELDFGQHDNEGNKRDHGDVGYSYYNKTTWQQYRSFYQNYHVSWYNTIRQP